MRDVAQRFWSKVDSTGGPEACWPWRGALLMRRGGYGKFQAGTSRETSRAVRAHRWAYEDVNGPIPAGQVVMHRCDNPPCCNPAHLTLGTQADNLRDMHGKGRHWAQKAAAHAGR